MTSGNQSLLNEIERGALDDDTPIASTLRKCVILGGQAGSTELRDWAIRELRGYEKVEDLPPYRVIGAPIQVNAMVGNGWVKGQRISPSEIPPVLAEHMKEELPLRHGIGEIETMLQRAKSDGSVHLSLSADAARIFNQEVQRPFQRVTDIYWAVSVGTLAGVVDQVRTTLAELVAEIRAGLPAGQEVPSAELTRQALNVAVTGFGARVTLNNAQSSSGSQSSISIDESQAGAEDRRFWTRSRRIGGLMVGLATVAATVLAALQWWHPNG